MPGANASGYLAIIPIKRDPTAAASAVATNTAPLSIRIVSGISVIPSSDNIKGFTIKIYAIARNVVSPPIISLL